MDDIAIRVENLSKQYRIGGPQARYKTIREWLIEAAKAPVRRAGKSLRGGAYGAADMNQTIWALKNVSFEVARGEVVGIIGRNGAGKTTLLKILSRITKPTEGYADIRGRVGSLLEVGTGFHPELTGRENIYLNGAILGMRRKELERKFDEIVAFSGVERFIDTPVKHYSSGMYLRLAFAVASHLEPDILLVDEVLAVGDFEFQKKCLGRMGQISHEGRTVLFVSHNIAAVEALCQKGIVLEHGKVQYMGSAIDAIHTYATSKFNSGVAVRLDDHLGRPGHYKMPILQSLRFLDERQIENNVFAMGQDITFEIAIDTHGESYKKPYVGIGVNNWMGQRLCTLNSQQQYPGVFAIEGTKTIRCVWHDCLLLPGHYNIEVWVKQAKEHIDAVYDAAEFEIISSDLHGTGRVQTGVGIFEARASWEIEP